MPGDQSPQALSTANVHRKDMHAAILQVWQLSSYPGLRLFPAIQKMGVKYELD